MKKTLNQIVAYNQYFADKHLQVNSFSFGELNEITNINNTQVKYPLLHLQVDSSSIDENYTYVTINHLCMDLTNKSENNTKDVLSDTLQILNDLRLWFSKKVEFHREGLKIQSSNLEPFHEEHRDEVTGWNLKMTYQIQNTGICNIPFYTPAPPAFSCTGNEPVLEFSPDLELVQVCEDSTIQIEAINIMTGQSTGNTFVWTLPDSVTHYTGSTITVNNASEIHTGRFDVVATNASGCSTSGFILVSVLPKPILSIIDIVNESSPGANDGRFIIEATGADEPYIYTDGFNVNFDGNFDLMAAGNYTVEVTSANSCTATIQVTIN